MGLQEEADQSSKVACENIEKDPSETVVGSCAARFSGPTPNVGGAGMQLLDFVRDSLAGWSSTARA
jgi:hypothetical protein